MSTTWDGRFFERSVVYEPLRAAAAPLAGADWPTFEDLQRVLAARAVPVVTRGGAPLTFVPQRANRSTFEGRYEPRVYLRGEVQLRTRNWHDFFNALVWLTFPHSKAALNARNFRALEAQQAAWPANRGPVQDALTLFDESGLVVAAADRELLRQLGDFAWHELFWRNRARVAAEMRFYVFGHALYEKMLTPYRGITGRAIRLEVDESFLAAPVSEQLEAVDAALAHRLLDPDELCSTRELAPVPVLGVPGWYEPNRDEAFYEDSDYFRPGRRNR
jgi:hypothetical protein